MLKKINKTENYIYKSDQFTKKVLNVSNALKYLIISDNEWAKLMLKEKCFICRKSNHMNKNYSKWLIDDKIIEFKIMKKQMQNQAMK